MRANERAYLEAVTIERVFNHLGKKLPNPVTESLNEYREKFELFEKASENLAAARVAQAELVAAQKAARSEAAKQAQPDPTDPAELEAQAAKVDYQTLSVRETGNMARLAGKKLARVIAENHDELMPQLVANYEAQLVSNAETQKQAQELLDNAHALTNDALQAIKSVALMSSKTAVTNAAKAEKESIRSPKLAPVPTPTQSRVVAAIKNPPKLTSNPKPNTPRILMI